VVQYNFSVVFNSIIDLIFICKNIIRIVTHTNSKSNLNQHTPTVSVTLTDTVSHSESVTPTFNVTLTVTVISSLIVTVIVTLTVIVTQSVVLL